MATAALASIPGADGVIHGCYTEASGRLRVMDPSTETSCSPSETRLDWNQVGPTGARGPRGPQGAPAPAAVAARIDTPATTGGASQQIPNMSEVPIHFSTRRFDTADLRVSASRLQVRTGGVYSMSAGLLWPGAAQNASTAGMRQLEIWVNGTAVPAGTNEMAVTDANTTLQTVTTLWKLNAGDYVEARAHQWSGAPLTLPRDQRTFLAIHSVVTE